MKNENQVLLSLLTDAIHNKTPEQIHQASIQWAPIYEDAKAHQVHSMLYPVIKELPSEIRPDPLLLSIWQKEMMITASTQLNHIERMKDILSLLQREGCSVILLKGLILRKYYPHPELRTMSDADLLVNVSDMNIIRKILLNLGYVEAEDTLKHFGFYHNDYPGIELHWVLSKMEEQNNTTSITDQMRKNVIETYFHGIPVLTLSTEDQFLHQILHLVNHFTTSGFGLRQLCDLTLFIEAEHPMIDWSNVNDQLINYNVKHFADVIITICSRLLGLKKPAIFSDLTEELSYINLMIEDILKSGIYGSRTPDRKASNSFTKYDVDSSSKCLKGFRYIVRLFFPSAKHLGSGYSYIRKYPYLLPLAWIHRIINNVTRVEFLKYSKEIKATSKERTKLLHWLQLP